MDNLLDLNTWRSIVTVLSMATFLGLVAWTYSRKNTRVFDEAACLPFQGEAVNQTRMGGTHE